VLFLHGVGTVGIDDCGCNSCSQPWGITPRGNIRASEDIGTTDWQIETVGMLIYWQI